MKIHLIAGALLPATLLAVAHAPAPAQTNPVALADCEPICLRQPYQVDKTGKFFFYQWMTVSKPGPSLAGKVQNRFLDAAAVRIYRGANERLTLADIGTVGLFRGTNNGWFATGHRGNYERFLGPDTPIGPDQPVICLREDWLDLKAGDLVIVDRLAETADGRIRQGLGKAGKDLLPWKTEGNVRADLVLHDARALAEADDWSTHGQGCLRIRNDEPRKAGYAQQVLRRDTRPVEMVFRARLVDASEPLDLTCTFAGKNIATVKLENRWRPIRISLPAGRSGHQGLGFALPPRAQLEVDDFRPAGPPHATATPQRPQANTPAAPSAASMEALLSGVRPTTIRLGPGGPELLSWPRATIVESLQAAAEAETSKVSLQLSCLHGEQDWWNLIEYLAAPYDPRTDTPRLKPYAYRRSVVQEHPAPWIESVAIALRLVHNDPAAGDTAREIERAMSSYVTEVVLPRSPYWKAAESRISTQRTGDHAASPTGE